MSEKWEKQESETQKNYNLFCVYRDMGITRTIPKVVLKLNRPERYRGHLQNLSAEFKWVDRCASYDEYLDEENRKANIEAIKKMNEDTIKLAQQLRKLPGVKLSAMMGKLQIAVQSGDPATIEEATKDIPLYLIPQLIQTAFELERKARGVSDKMEMDATVTHVINSDELDKKMSAKLRSVQDANSGSPETVSPG